MVIQLRSLNTQKEDAWFRVGIRFDTTPFRSNPSQTSTSRDMSEDTKRYLVGVHFVITRAEHGAASTRSRIYIFSLVDGVLEGLAQRVSRHGLLRGKEQLIGDGISRSFGDTVRELDLALEGGRVLLGGLQATAESILPSGVFLDDARGQRGGTEVREQH